MCLVPGEKTQVVNVRLERRGSQQWANTALELQQTLTCCVAGADEHSVDAEVDVPEPRGGEEDCMAVQAGDAGRADVVIEREGIRYRIAGGTERDHSPALDDRLRQIERAPHLGGHVDDVVARSGFGLGALEQDPPILRQAVVDELHAGSRCRFQKTVWAATSGLRTLRMSRFPRGTGNFEIKRSSGRTGGRFAPLICDSSRWVRSPH